MKSMTAIRVVTMAFLVGSAPAFAHGPMETVEIGSTADGSGALATFFHFHERVARLSYSTTVGPNSIYTGALPAFESLPADDAPDLYVLDPGTQVSVEITAIDEGASVTINSTLLDEVGESVLLGTEPIAHNHPAWTLSLELPAGSFGEATISFKLTSPSYAESENYTVKFTNGVLSAPEYATGDYDKPGVACRKTVGKAGQKFFDKKLSLLRKCADALQVKEAKEALTTPPSDLADADAKAEAACVGESGADADKTMLGKIEAARAKAFAAIQDECAIAAGMSDNDISQHLGLLGCRAEELLGSMYGNAKAAMSEYVTQVSQGGGDLDDSFPCLKTTIAE